MASPIDPTEDEPAVPDVLRRAVRGIRWAQRNGLLTAAEARALTDKLLRLEARSANAESTESRIDGEDRQLGPDRGRQDRLPARRSRAPAGTTLGARPFVCAAPVQAVGQQAVVRAWWVWSFGDARALCPAEHG
jgi:hypothetical protein